MPQKLFGMLKRLAQGLWFASITIGSFIAVMLVVGPVGVWVFRGGLGFHTLLNLLWMPWVLGLLALNFVVCLPMVGVFSFGLRRFQDYPLLWIVVIAGGTVVVRWIHANFGPYPTWVSWLFWPGFPAMLVTWFVVGALDCFAPKPVNQTMNAVGNA